jgi:hypothetical protein
VELGKLTTGENLLEVEMPYGSTTFVENMFLLGDFGVEILGTQAKATAPVRELAFGDWTQQGLPFYGGNVTYILPKLFIPANLQICVPQNAQPLVVAEVDGERAGVAAIAPYAVDLSAYANGEHEIRLIAFGNRTNTFGILHQLPPIKRYTGPSSWSGKSYQWGYEYHPVQSGILSAPLFRYVEA